MDRRIKNTVHFDKEVEEYVDKEVEDKEVEEYGDKENEDKEVEDYGDKEVEVEDKEIEDNGIGSSQVSEIGSSRVCKRSKISEQSELETRKLES